MASPNLTTECTAFPHLPKRKVGYDVDLIPFEDEATVSIKVSDTKHLKPITLNYVNQSDSEQASFEAFFDARKASFEAFYWNDLRTGVSDIKVKFLESAVEFIPNSVRTWSWTVTLVRVTS